MTAQARKARSKPSTRHKPTQSAPLTQMIVLDALRTWVIPTVAVVIGLIIFVIYNIGLIDEAPAVTIVGSMALLTVTFAGVRSFFEDHVNPTLIAVIATFTALFGLSAFYPFYRTLNPGTPAFSTELKRGAAATLPLHDKPGHYNVIFEGHFLPVEGRQNRTAAYTIAMGQAGRPERVFSGAFNEEWRSQRIGAGRRSSIVPSLHQSTEVRDVIDAPEGRDLTMTLTDLSQGVRDSVSIRLYVDAIPQWLFVALGVLTLAGALLLDTWRPKGKNEGLMGTLTAATLISVIIFTRSTVATPGFPQLVIAALVGTLVGAIAGSLLWRLTFPLKKYLPALE